MAALDRCVEQHADKGAKPERGLAEPMMVANLPGQTDRR